MPDPNRRPISRRGAPELPMGWSRPAQTGDDLSQRLAQIGPQGEPYVEQYPGTSPDTWKRNFDPTTGQEDLHIGYARGGPVDKSKWIDPQKVTKRNVDQYVEQEIQAAGGGQDINYNRGGPVGYANGGEVDDQEFYQPAEQQRLQRDQAYGYQDPEIERRKATRTGHWDEGDTGYREREQTALPSLSDLLNWLHKQFSPISSAQAEEAPQTGYEGKPPPPDREAEWKVTPQPTPYQPPAGGSGTVEGMVPKEVPGVITALAGSATARRKHLKRRSRKFHRTIPGVWSRALLVQPWIKSIRGQNVVHYSGKRADNSEKILQERLAVGLKVPKRPLPTCSMAIGPRLYRK